MPKSIWTEINQSLRNKIKSEDSVDFFFLTSTALFTENLFLLDKQLMWYFTKVSPIVFWNAYGKYVRIYTKQMINFCCMIMLQYSLWYWFRHPLLLSTIHHTCQIWPQSTILYFLSWERLWKECILTKWRLSNQMWQDYCEAFQKNNFFRAFQQLYEHQTICIERESLRWK